MIWILMTFIILTILFNWKIALAILFISNIVFFGIGIIDTIINK